LPQRYDLIYSGGTQAEMQQAEQPKATTTSVAWSAPGRFGDLVSHGLPHHYDEHGRRYRATQRLVDDFRNVIRRCSELTFRNSFFMVPGIAHCGGGPGRIQFNVIASWSNVAAESSRVDIGSLNSLISFEAG
jgi:hypothetical protein